MYGIKRLSVILLLCYYTPLDLGVATNIIIRIPGISRPRIEIIYG